MRLNKYEAILDYAMQGSTKPEDVAARVSDPEDIAMAMFYTSRSRKVFKKMYLALLCANDIEVL